jgi:hypothetical protein
MSPSAQTNLERLQNQQLVSVATISSESEIPPISPQSVVLDGLFGSGLTRPLSGLPEKIVRTINQSGATVIAIDIPSGLFGEDNSGNDLNKVIRATYTLTFQFPKLSFFFPEHDALLGQWEVLPIGLHPDAITSVESSYKLIDEEMASGLINKRKKFSHKGTYGHALLIAGSYGKMGPQCLPQSMPSRRNWPADNACAALGLSDYPVQRSGSNDLDRPIGPHVYRVPGAVGLFCCWRWAGIDKKVIPDAPCTTCWLHRLKRWYSMQMP